MRVKSIALVAAAVSIFATSSASAFFAEILVTGQVEFNQIGSGFLGNVNPGDDVEMRFLVDSRVFVDSATFPTRGYVIDPATWSLTFNGNNLGLQNPFPAGQTAYFVLRDNDPAVDGFFVSTNVDFPVGVPVDQTGIFDQFSNNFSVTYTGDTLDSLGIFDAEGTYNFDGLTVFNWTIDDGPFQPLGIVFEQMTIEKFVVPLPGAWLLMASGIAVFGWLRRR